MFLPDLISAEISWWFALFPWGLRCVCDLRQVLPAESGSSEGGGPMWSVRVRGLHPRYPSPNFLMAWIRSGPNCDSYGMVWDDEDAKLLLVDGYPLVNSHIAMENHHFLWENLYFYGHFQLLFWHHQRVCSKCLHQIFTASLTWWCFKSPPGAVRSSKLSRHPLSCISRSGTMHLNGLGVSEPVFDFWCIKDDKVVVKIKWCYNMYDLYIYIYTII